MKKSMMKKTAAVAMTICMVGTMMPWNASFAAEADADQAPKTEAAQIENNSEAKAEAPAKAEPKQEAPAQSESSEPKAEAPAQSEPKQEAPAKAEPKQEAPAATENSEPKTEAPAAQETKTENAEAVQNEAVSAEPQEASEEAQNAGSETEQNNEAEAAAETQTAEKAEAQNTTVETDSAVIEKAEAEVEEVVLKAAEENNVPQNLTKSLSRQIMNQEDCDFTLEYDDNEYEISFQENVLTITGKNDGPATEVNIRMKDGKASTAQRIVLAGTTVTVLEKVNILAQVGSAIALDQNTMANATIIISGDVSLQGQHGIAVMEGTEVTIKGATGMEGNDSLTVKGGGVKGNSNWGTGIGYYVKGGEDAGTINIKDIAEVTATGSSAGEGGAAIGGGRKNSADNGIINLENIGKLNAYGGGKAAAIGAGFWKAADINIMNCYIENAIGGSTAAGIGSSRNTIEALSSEDWLDADKMSVLTTRINIENSVIENAAGGKNGAGIGTGTSDQLWGDYSRNMGTRPGSDYALPQTEINISGNSDITARGGDQAAGIGGGYKVTAPEVTIGSGSKVTAYAGKSKGTSDKVASAIGGGADGSSIYTDKDGSINVEDGAEVYAFGYGYEAFPADKDAKSGVIGNKWALARDLQDDDTTAVIFNGRFLDKDHFSEEAFQEGYSDLSKDHQIELTNLRTGESTSFVLPKGYTSFATTLKEGEYKLTVDGEQQAWSYLDGKGYSAVTDGAVTGTSQLVYGDEEIAEANINYEQVYQTYGNKGDSVTVRYAFGDASANFKVSKGTNNFDAIAIRENVEPVAPADPEPEVDEVIDEQDPEAEQEKTADTEQTEEQTPVAAQNAGGSAEAKADAPEAKTFAAASAAKAGKTEKAAAKTVRTAAIAGSRTVAAGNTVTAQAETAAPAAGTFSDSTTPLADFSENGTPLTTTAAWAVLNLLLAILTAVMSIILLIGYLGRKNKEDENGEEIEIRKKGMARIAGMVPAIAGIILFILTEDMTLPMQWMDSWTIWQAVILAAELIIAVLCRKSEKEEDEANAAA